MGHIVYAAVNIANGKRYVGYTSVGLEGRRRAHHTKAFGGLSAVRFHAALRKYGRDAFVWEVISSFENRAEALAEEIRLIAEMKPEYNVTAGGDGATGQIAWNRKPVTCLETAELFVSATAAGKKLGLSVVTVTDVCNGKYRSARGLHFVWGSIERNQAALIREIEAAHAERRRRHGKPKQYGSAASGIDKLGRSTAGPLKNSRPVICVTDGGEFPSVSEAARHYNIASSAITGVCRKHQNRKTASGLVFAYKEAA